MRRPALIPFTDELLADARPAWLAEQRRVALAQAHEHPWPTSADEIWRYSRIDQLRLSDYALAGPPSGPAASPSSAIPAGYAAVIRMIDGQPAEVTVSHEAAQSGLTCTTLRHLDAEPSDLIADADASVYLCIALASDGLLIDVVPGAVVEQPILVEHRITASGALVAGRVHVRVGRGGSATIVERISSASSTDAAANLVLSLVELDVADGAQLRYVNVQELAADTWQLAHQVSRTGRDATLRTMAVALGGHYARLRTDARMDGTGGFNELLAVFFGSGEQMHDFRTIQDHHAPRTKSDLLFKGAVEDEAKSVYSGLIRIGKDAARSVANQTNRNLVLSPQASAESVPNLEILNNDVSCSHGSAVGPIDDDHRYYLESRGVPPEAAERLIVLGFFGDILSRIPDPALVAQLEDAVRVKFEQRVS